MGTYRVAWIVESDAGIIAISNVFSAGKLVQVNVSKDAWGELLAFIGGRGRVSECQSDLAVDDGSSYFGTIAVDGTVQNFAVYGIVPVPRRSGDQKIYEKMAPCSDFVEAVTHYCFRVIGPCRQRAWEGPEAKTGIRKEWGVHRSFDLKSYCESGRDSFYIEVENGYQMSGAI